MFLKALFKARLKHGLILIVTDLDGYENAWIHQPDSFRSKVTEVFIVNF